MNVMRQCMFDANVDTRVHKPQALLHRMSVIKNRMQVAATPDNWDGDEYAVRNARLCASYQTVLAEANGLDFDDLLLATVRTLHEHLDARRAAGDRFPRVLVDEFQDTNLPQYVLVRQLAEEHDDVFVVGDPDQAIYGCRGADLANIMSFQRDFPAARRIDLQLAYRSSARLLEAATRARSASRAGDTHPAGRSAGFHRFLWEDGDHLPGTSFICTAILATSWSRTLRAALAPAVGLKACRFGAVPGPCAGWISQPRGAPGGLDNPARRRLAPAGSLLRPLRSSLGPLSPVALSLPWRSSARADVREAPWRHSPRLRIVCLAAGGTGEAG